MTKTTIQERLQLLREYMRSKGLSAFIVPSSDPHMSEYPAKHWESREWISGFDGSAGLIVVTQDKAGLWTDSRYFLQANKQLKDTGIELFKQGLSETPDYAEWLTEQLRSSSIVGVDGRVYSAVEANRVIQVLGQKNITLNGDYDPFNTIWIDRPSIPENPIFELPEKFTGESTDSKIAKIRTILRAENTESIIISSLDSIAWVFNIRGNDVKCNPVAVAFAFISLEESVLFINPKKLTSEIIDYFNQKNIIVSEYDKFYDFIAKSNKSVCLDSSKTSWAILTSISGKILEKSSPIDFLKSVKNQVELQGFRNAMIKDGVALIKFFIWLEKALNNKEDIRETTISDKLVEYRSEQEFYVGESFETICGYQENGAIVHYHAVPETAKKIEANGFLLIDSGAQYFDGTTDITRTVALGELSEEMKKDYTNVLKGHIQLALAIFPKGTRGTQLDILARKALWDNGLNYLHGTGHGIGHFLNVHEGPQSIRMNENPTTLEVGMVTSNEPGIYREGKYGIRLENLIVTQEKMHTEFGNFYSFETITLCPFDNNAIIRNLLTDQEILWYNQYHRNVYDKLSNFLNDEEKKWLKKKTDEI